jgi:carboxymethylenebutenolidase
MKKLIHVLLGAAIVAGCQQSAPPASDQGAAAQVEATAAAHRDDAPVASPVASEPPTRPVLEQPLAYGEIGNRNLDGFLAMPADAAEPLPGLLVIHEWWGLNDNMRAVTRRLAAEGYIALAVDLYGGATAETPEQAAALMAKAAENPENVRDNLRQAYEYLDKYAFSPTIGSIGWCFGGGWSLQTALMFPDELDAMVMYYGQVVTDRDQLEPLKVPILGLFAERDQAIPLREVQTFRSLLQDLGKDAEVRIYSRVGHAFANPSGGTYDAEAAEDAWRRTLDFLDLKLRKSGAP